jgi:hypothetical protein
VDCSTLGHELAFKCASPADGAGRVAAAALICVDFVACASASQFRFFFLLLQFASDNWGKETKKGQHSPGLSLQPIESSDEEMTVEVENNVVRVGRVSDTGTVTWHQILVWL